MATRRRVAGARVALRRASAPARRLPELLVVGTQRGGTSSLFRFLSSHPDVRRPVRKEIEYFAAESHRPRSWYRAHFPIRSRRQVSMDCTPQYLFHPHAAARAAAVVPQARVVVLLRDPVARAHSHWRHMTTLGHETLSFADAVAAEPERTDDAWQRMLDDPEFHSREVMRFSYVRRGQYADHLAPWQGRFAPGRLLVVETERLISRPEPSLAEIERFVGISPTGARAFENASPSHRGSEATLDPDLAGRLAEAFEDSNRRLRATGWTATWL